MSDSRLTIRLSPKLRKRIRQRVKDLGTTEADFVRSSLEGSLNLTKPRSAYKALLRAGLIGCAPGAPPDLSTNKKYMEGFGEWRDDSHRRRPGLHEEF